MRWLPDNIKQVSALFHAPITAFGLTLAMLLTTSGCSTPAPNWIKALGYEPSEVHELSIGEFGYPYLPIQIGDTRLVLPFDTGNMIGVTVSTRLFDEIGLDPVRSHDRFNSAGEKIATLRVARPVSVSLLGRNQGPTTIYEFDHPTLPGLVGPAIAAGNHFTIDYQSRKFATGTDKLPDTLPGFQPIPLVRSGRHPLLVLVRGAIDGQSVIIQLDTGKSRTVVNPDLVSSIGLKRGTRGVQISSLQIGDLSFEVPNAKEVDQTAIDPDLTEPILAGIGSDILSRFVWTVDYEARVLWIPSSP